MSKKKGAELSQAMPAVASPEQHDYETQGHLDTLIKAHGIMNDGEKMKKVHALAGRQHKALAGIKKVSVTSTDDLRKISNKMAMKKSHGLDTLKDNEDELTEGGE